MVAPVDRAGAYYVPWGSARQNARTLELREEFSVEHHKGVPLGAAHSRPQRCASSLAACGGSSGGSGGSSQSPVALNTITVWDPYPQYDETSDWAKYLQACAPEGTTLTRTSAAHGRPAQQPDDRGQGRATRLTWSFSTTRLSLTRPRRACSRRLATSVIDTSGFDENLAGPGHRRRRDLRRPDRREHPRPVLQRGHPQEGRRRPGQHHGLGRA